MCNYVKENKCLITNQVCPYVYYCDKTRGYKPSSNMPQDCKVKQTAEIPDGYCRVRDVRKDYLYIDYGEITIKVKNPFSFVPQYVKVIKTKAGYKLRK